MTTRHRFRTIQPDIVESTTHSDANGTWEGKERVIGYEWREIYDVSTPNYHKLVAEGHIVNNPCELRSRSLEQLGFCAFTRTKDSDPSTGWSAEGGSYALAYDSIIQWPNPIPSEKKYLDLAKAIALSNMDSTPWSFGEDVMEIKETIQFLRNPMQGLIKLLKEIKKLEFAKRHDGTLSPKQLAKATADAWTEYRFALAPLVRSISDLLDALSSQHYREPPRLTARGFSSDYSEESFTKTGILNEQNCSYDCWVGRTVDVHASILYEVSNPLVNWRRKYGLRNKDIPTTLWQVVPLSFLVDRVVNISATIQGLLNLSDPELKILAASVRIKSRHDKTWQMTKFDKQGWTTTGSLDGFALRDFRYLREPWKPTASDTLPTVKPMGLFRDTISTLDSLAVAIQRLL